MSELRKKLIDDENDDDEIIQETPDMGSQDIQTASQKRSASELTDDSTKKQKFEVTTTHYNQPSPDLFDSPYVENDDGGMSNDHVSIPQDNGEQKGDDNDRAVVDDDDDNDGDNDGDGQCDDNDAIHNSNVSSLENLLVSLGVPATPPNPYTESLDFHSVKDKVIDIIAGLASQKPETSEIEQQPATSLQQQQQAEPSPQQQQLQQQQQQAEPSPQQQQLKQQQQSEIDLPPKSPEQLEQFSAENLIEELSTSFERINKLFGEINESSKMAQNALEKLRSCFQH